MEREAINVVRNVVGVIVGVICWMLGFYALAIGLSLLWPDYAVHGRQWVKEGAFTFTPLMACCNLVFWALDEFAAGWVTAKISQRHVAVWILSVLLGMYLLTLHLVMYWARFPWWYNLGVVSMVVPAVWWGGHVADGGRRSRAALPTISV